ncbi:MAG: (d)CMP kinase [Acidobacteria bacterium]|nr:(d)CMP kinase [Acidobacteriota bacterium]|tara:strand:- start:2057 stop:2710 length:654 start_codon:yes stop_codon:yes gene_type:complete
MSRLRIAIDGPSGSGKSTLGKALAQRLCIPYVDTGAMYRAISWAVADVGLNDDVDQIVSYVQNLELKINPDSEGFQVWVNEIDVTDWLRQPGVGRMAAKVATIKEVRAWMVPRQRAAAIGGGVLEGRDIGTVVLPDADFKFYITSDESTRMLRRAEQLGLKEVVAEVVSDVHERDRVDSTRKHSPLRPAADAVHIDTTCQTVDESLSLMLKEINRHR